MKGMQIKHKTSNIVKVSLFVTRDILVINSVKTLSLKSCFGKYCYQNGNGVFKMINKSSENKNNGLVYMINEYTKIYSNNISVKNRG